MLPITFLSAHEMVGPLRKTYGIEDGKNASYPMAGKFTSSHHEFEISKDGLRAYFETLKSEAALGKALFKGQLKRPLENESRKGMTDQQAMTQLLVLDIDGIEIPGVAFDGRTIGNEDLRSVALQILATLPPKLQQVSCIAAASSSFGRSNEVSMHLHFFLEKKVSPAAMKTWLKSLNYELEFYRDNLSLTPSMQGVKSIIDPCTAENSRIIYCAPPKFGKFASDPFDGDETARMFFIDKVPFALDITDDINNCNAAVVAKKDREKRTELLKAMGLSTREHKTTTLQIDGVSQRVITNPNALNLVYASHDDLHVRYNINGGDSNAYWVRRDNPAVVYCFKPDEAPFLFEASDRETYTWHIDNFGGKVTETKDETGKKRNVQPFAFIDYYSSGMMKVEYDKEVDEIVEISATTRGDATDWYMEHGLPEPDLFHHFKMEMRPGDTRQVDFHNKTVNLFRPTEYMRTVRTLGHDEDGLGYGYGHILQHYCPNIWKVMYHMLGSNHDSYEHFINWLAYIFQTRKKAKTAWFLQGTEGTGKGFFFEHVLRPLFARHAVQKTLNVIADDQFNGWMEEACILMVDEFNTENATSGQKKAEALLKNLITETSMNIRRMRSENVDKRNFLNFIFATNDIGAVNLSEGQRRYNIAPRQERMIQDVYPEIKRMKEFDAKIADELLDFSAFLHDFQVDEGQVMKVLKTEAEAQAVHDGKNAQERFFDSFRKGDLEFFCEVAFQDASQFSPQELPRRAGLMETIKRWIRNAENGSEMRIPVADLRIVYSFLSGKDVPATTFGRMLSGNNIHANKVSGCYGTPGGKQQRATSTVWALDATVINDYRASVGLVTDVLPIDNTQQEQQAV